MRSSAPQTCTTVIRTATAISTWNGDVWRVDGLDADLDRLEWRRIASGLSQPLGLATRDDEILVVGRDQITRLVDLDGDRETDRYEAFNVDAMNSPHFHEPASGLQVGPDGSLYYIKAARHAKLPIHPRHGTLIRIEADGSDSEIVASGFRAPNLEERYYNGPVHGSLLLFSFWGGGRSCCWCWCQPLRPPCCF